MPSGGPAHQQQQLQQQQQYGQSQQNGQGGHDEESRASGTDYSDSYEESDGDDYTSQAGHESIGSQSDTLMALSIQSARMATEEEDEDDDRPQHEPALDRERAGGVIFLLQNQVKHGGSVGRGWWLFAIGRAGERPHMPDQ